MGRILFLTRGGLSNLQSSVADVMVIRADVNNIRTDENNVRADLDNVRSVYWRNVRLVSTSAWCKRPSGENVNVRREKVRQMSKSYIASADLNVRQVQRPPGVTDLHQADLFSSARCNGVIVMMR